MPELVSRSTKHTPRVSIGMAVFNGENYLAEAVDSLLAQTYADFELIISDNASTDATETICREYARRDPRICYQRQDANRGAAWNQNYVMRAARGEYFKLAAHDDLCEPAYLERCVAAADADPKNVVVFPATSIMLSGSRRRQRYWEDDMDTAHAAPNVRFRELLFKMEWCAGFRVFGLIRREALMRTPLFGGFKGADDVLVMRLALLGPFLKLPDRLFLYRRHPKQSMQLAKDPAAYYAWWDQDNAGRRVYPTWRYAAEVVRALRQSPLDPVERSRCYGHLMKWLRQRKNVLLRELRQGQRAAPGRSTARIL